MNEVHGNTGCHCRCDVRQQHLSYLAPVDNSSVGPGQEHTPLAAPAVVAAAHGALLAAGLRSAPPAMEAQALAVATQVANGPAQHMPPVLLPAAPVVKGPLQATQPLHAGRTLRMCGSLCSSSRCRCLLLLCLLEPATVEKAPLRSAC
jgi:hypothetical protein